MKPEKLKRMSKTIELFAGKKALLLDMNGTFMFGEDRFGPSEDFSQYYSSIGGILPREEINVVIRRIYEYLSLKYEDVQFRHCFPSIQQAVFAISDITYEDEEVQRIVATFAHHELGEIPPAYVNALRVLRQWFVLGSVIDVWSPKASWLQVFRRSRVDGLFDAMSFSSDHGMVKPSPRPFEFVLKQLNVCNTEAIVVGDSPRRDLGGAKYAGIDCILVGGVEHPDALAHFNSLLEFSTHIKSHGISYKRLCM